MSMKEGLSRASFLAAMAEISATADSGDDADIPVDRGLVPVWPLQAQDMGRFEKRAHGILAVAVGDGVDGAVGAFGEVLGRKDQAVFAFFGQDKYSGDATATPGWAWELGVAARLAIDRKGMRSEAIRGKVGVRPPWANAACC